MESNYFKRFRMDADVLAPREPAVLPPGYQFVAWNKALLDVHARTKYRAFRGEVDAIVFPCLGSLEGCRRLMREIHAKEGFLPEASWLIAWGRSPEDLQWCGTIQAVRDRSGIGSIQNVGIIPGHRGQGLGTCLIQKALTGFAQQGIRWASLEVTADNASAVRLYQRLGFRRSKTVYKLVEEPPVCITGFETAHLSAGRTTATVGGRS